MQCADPVVLRLCDGGSEFPDGFRWMIGKGGSDSAILIQRFGESMVTRMVCDCATTFWCWWSRIRRPASTPLVEIQGFGSVPC